MISPPPCSDIHYLLHYKTTVVLLIHIWAILVPVSTSQSLLTCKYLSTTTYL